MPRLARARDDESWRLLAEAWTAAYDEAARQVWGRILQARQSGIAADQWLTDGEWQAIREDTGVDDALADTVNDGIVAAAITLNIPPTDRMLDDAVDEFIRSTDDGLDYIRSNLDDYWQRHGDRVTGTGWRTLTESAASPLARSRAIRFAYSQANGATNAGYWSVLNAAPHPDEFAAQAPIPVAAIRWVTQRDERVRPAHVAADTDTIPLGQTFDIGGYEARFPGDPHLPIGLRINCRCFLAWVDGTEVRRIIGARRFELYAKARELDIPGRSKMNKAQLQSALLEELCLNGLAGGPDCPDMFDAMNKPTLLTYARQEKIVGRWRMTKPELIENLRATMRGSDRIRVAQGFAPRTEFAETQRLATARRRTAAQLPLADEPLPNRRVRRQSRDAVYRDFGGPERGYTPCAFCGLKVNPDPASGFAVLVPTPIRAFADGGRAIAANMLPGCPACFQAHSAQAATRALAASAGKSEGWDGDPDAIIPLPPAVGRRARARIAAMPEPDPEEFRYDPNQPRVPAGSPEGGRWTDTPGRERIPIPEGEMEQALAVEEVYGGARFTDDEGNTYHLEGYGGGGPGVNSWTLGGEPVIDVEGIIVSESGKEVGEFDRKVEFEARLLHNGTLTIEPEFRGKGIGTAFLDRTEQALQAKGIERIRVSAVDVGRYAWAARGFRLDSSRTNVRNKWVAKARDMIIRREVPLTSGEAINARKVLSYWSDNPDDVYPADLLAISPEFRHVFLEGPTWSGSRNLIEEDQLALAASAPTPLLDYKVRSWKDFAGFDPNQPRDDHGRWTATGGEKPPVGATVLDDTEADRAWAEREGNARLSGDGDCYVAAHRAMRDDPRYRLVHGVVSGQGDLEGVRFDHAWVERTDSLPDELLTQVPEAQREAFKRMRLVTVIDQSNGNDIELPAELYYKVGEIDQTTVHRYTWDEMAVAMVRHGTYGPWDDEETP